ncbi:ABC transporter substrate-binding protein [Lipingzhangella sp. LS1_29]|uniref:ABC transporter substrate-binding protein n=1 Tax=Lipingzhangella rawalii TaxID=2055835 RepID=A0ABU2H745_9ACTN|nr:ABC transporter substrate-binding protein [Lipingzhangella rawalii]MDS1271132.1 ABC transporter substrate-binding protein [Lipingzhangella rawalii]
MRRTRAHTALAALGATALALSGCGTGADDDGEAGGELTIGTMTMPQSLDPAEAMGAALPFFQAVYDTLLLREPDGSYAPMLATDWSYDESRTELQLELRDDVTFTDGTPFDAEAVQANLERFPEAGGGQAQTLSDLEEVEIVDDHDVVIHLEQPNPALLFYLSDAAGLMANPNALDDDTLATEPDGTGPYELDTGNTAIGSTWAYTRSDDYWGEDLPYDEVTITVFDNENALVNGLRTGQINSALIQEVDQQDVVADDEDLHTVDQDIDMQSLLLFDREGEMNPALGDTEVRQALNYALDREAMLEHLRSGQGEITNQIFGPESVAYDPELDTYYDHDPERARELLAEAGHEDGVELTLPKMQEIVGDPLATSIENDLGDVGIDVTWDNLDEGDAIQSIMVEQAYPGMVMNNAQPASEWVTIVELVLPGTFNFLGTMDDTIAERTAEIQQAPEGEAADAAQELNRHLVEEAWFVPFYRMTYQHVTDDSVEVEPQSGMAVPSLYNYSPLD